MNDTRSSRRNHRNGCDKIIASVGTVIIMSNRIFRVRNVYFIHQPTTNCRLLIARHALSFSPRKRLQIFSVFRKSKSRKTQKEKHNYYYYCCSLSHADGSYSPIHATSNSFPLYTHYNTGAPPIPYFLIDSIALITPRKSTIVLLL